ncbi:signal peptide peptidase SppA [Wenzhouxiangella marina]|uniref:Endopeptidase IV n=1 Tax=Wenzhouxiangella marina TaxID=1579979 RepID=A0A0K0XYV7_9GAMM|nr:signal peptide peptidase SppA [Wenzhouxiangella marina]AKS42855.1 endopeptidase IV [Wenzhouxiangella marina]MBB6087463.1 protease-4 [Wenzhouxiangella marina]
MTTHRPNILVRLWLGFWNGVTALRMAVFNILFLIVLALVLRAIFAGGEALVLDDDTTLVISPRGVIVEEYVGTPFERAVNEALGQELPQTRLRDIVATLEFAAGDDKVTQVLIQTDRLIGMGPGMLNELEQAFTRFRESGKRVIAHGGWMSQGQYFMASLADEIWLDRDGMVLLQGYGMYRQYYADGLEMLEVDVNLIRVGEYKSAMEPYIRNDMSEADREARQYLIDDLWQRYLDHAASNRGMPVEVLADLTNNFPAYLEQAGGSMSQMALDRGLVDRLVSRPELRSELALSGASDEESGYRRIGMSEYLEGRQLMTTPGDRQVGVIVAQGTIVEGSQPPGTIGGDSTARLIRQAAQDDKIEAVVLRIDSGGGSAFASEVIRTELMNLRDAGKPVVVSMGNVAASGGYWIAMGADEVWAYPTTITGSIGIFGFFPTFQNTLAKIGVYTDGVGTTPLSGALRPDMAMDEETRRMLQNFIDHGYQEFIGLVAEHRNMSVEDVDAVAQGRIWTGAQAQDRGLVDHLGTLSDAIDSAARMAGLGEDYDVTYVEQGMEPWQAFLTGMGARALSMAGAELAPPEARVLPDDLRRRLVEDMALLYEHAGPGRTGVMAHCLCDVPR